MPIRYDIDPGRLRQRIQIEQPPATKDATGGRYGNWPVFATAVPAEVISGGGREQLGGDAFTALSAYTITIRYMSGITTSMRVSWDGKLFNIENLNDVEGRRRILVLTCTEGQTHGVA